MPRSTPQSSPMAPATLRPFTTTLWSPNIPRLAIYIVGGLIAVYALVFAAATLSRLLDVDLPVGFVGTVLGTAGLVWAMWPQYRNAQIVPNRRGLWIGRQCVIESSQIQAAHLCPPTSIRLPCTYSSWRLVLTLPTRRWCMDVGSQEEGELILRFLGHQGVVVPLSALPPPPRRRQFAIIWLFAIVVMVGGTLAPIAGTILASFL